MPIENSSQTQEFGFVQKSFDHKWYYMCSDWPSTWQKKSSLPTLWSPYCLLKDRAWSFFLLKLQNCFSWVIFFVFLARVFFLWLENYPLVWGKKKSVTCKNVVVEFIKSPSQVIFIPSSGIMAWNNFASLSWQRRSAPFTLKGKLVNWAHFKFTIDKMQHCGVKNVCFL